MRIVVTSDTHYHPKWQPAIEAFVDEIGEQQPDCVILAGDVGERVDGFQRMLHLLQRLPCPRLILPGNHDLWSRDGIPSEQLWGDTLPQITRDAGAIWLETANWSKDGVGVCGTIGWYDYSGRDRLLPMTEEQYFRAKPGLMVDGVYVNWTWNDLEFADLVGQAFSERLAALDADPSVREILVTTHVPAFAEAIERRPDNLAWSMSNAYFYNLTLGKRITASPKVNRVVSGHTHVGKHAQVGTPEHPVEMWVLQSDYGLPVYQVLDYHGARMDKIDIMKRIEGGYARLESTLAQLSEAQLTGVPVNGDWTAKDILAHLMYWERELLSWIDAAAEGQKPAVPTFSDDELNRVNTFAILAGRQTSLAEIRSSYREVHDRLIAAIRALPTDTENSPWWLVWQHPNGVTPWEIIANNTYEHYEEHLNPIQALIDSPASA